LIAERIQTRVLHYFVDAMIAHVVEGQRRLLTQRLLKFQVPLLVTRVWIRLATVLNVGGVKPGTLL